MVGKYFQSKLKSGRFLAVVLLCLLTLSLFSTAAFATGETNLDNKPDNGPNVVLSRTVIVGPAAANSPVQSGNALLKAIALIAKANPSATNPWLLKLQPGIYDLGSQSLTLLPYVDLEGSGEGITTITSTAGNPTFPPKTGSLVAASNSEVRLVKIANTGTAFYQIAVFVPANTTNVRFTHLTATATGGGSNTGLFNSGTTLTQDSTFAASGGNSAGLTNYNGTLTVQTSNISSSGNSTNYGFYNLSGSSDIANSILTASGGTNTGNYGLYITAGSSTVTNSSLMVSGGTNSANNGFYNNGGTGTLANSSINASGGFIAYGLFNSKGTSTVTNSTLTASSIGISRVQGTVNVFNSQLSGTTSASNGLAGTDCTFSVNGLTHNALNAACQ